MKAILAGIIAAIVIAGGAAMVLDTKVQQGAETAFATTGTRL